MKCVSSWEEKVLHEVMNIQGEGGNASRTVFIRLSAHLSLQGITRLTILNLYASKLPQNKEEILA
jgi:hypothetical protein